MRGREALTESEARRLREALNDLSELEPPPVWGRIQQKLTRPERIAPRRWAVAAAIAAAAVIGVGLWRLMPARPPAAAEPPMVALKAQAARLEGALAVMPRSRLARGDTSLAAAQLEDRLAEVDALLKVDSAVLAPRDRQELWQRRVSLLDSLVRVRYVANAEQSL